MEKIINEIIDEMSNYLNVEQIRLLQHSLVEHLSENRIDSNNIDNASFLKMFIDAKRIEGCSERTPFLLFINYRKLA